MAESDDIVLGLKIKDNEAKNSVKSLKSELRGLTNELANLEPGSEAFVTTAKRAGELKDKIEDAKNAVAVFNPEAKFQAFANVVGGVANGFAVAQGAMQLFGSENKNLQEMMAKTQATIAIATGLNGLLGMGDAFKNLKAVAIDALKGIKTAIGSTGIGLIVVALGALYAYWDDIKEAVGGVSEEQKQLNALSQKNLDSEKEKLDAIGSQDNILKLQGKSEKEILQMKVAQTDQTIKVGEINLQNQIASNKMALEAEKRNYRLLKSYIDFVSMPLNYLYKAGAQAINGIIELINKIPGVKIDAKLDENLVEKSADWLTKLAFDPKKTEEEGKKQVEEQQKYLTKLKNDRAGHQLQMKGIDQKYADEKKEKDKKLAEEEAKKRDKIAKDDAEFYENLSKKIKDEEKKEAKRKESLRQSNEDERKYKIETAKSIFEDTKSTEEEKNKALAELRRLDYENLGQWTKAEEDLDKKKMENKLAMLDAVSSGLNTFADLAGKDTEEGKALAIASALISTYTAIAKQLAAFAGVPIPGYAIVQAIATGVAGFAQVKSIMDVKVPSKNGGGGSGGGMPSMSRPALPPMVRPSSNMVTIGNESIRTQSNGIDQKVYVVESDITNTQNKVKAIEDKATIG